MQGYRLILVGIGIAAILTGVNGYLLTRAQLIDAARADALAHRQPRRPRLGRTPCRCSAALAVLVPLVLLGIGPRAADDRDGRRRCQRARRPRRAGPPAAARRGGAAGLARRAAAAGPVSFVALTAPQLAKRLTRAPGPNLLPALGMGAVLLVAADLAGAARSSTGHQLPVGVVTGAIGGAYLVWLLATSRRAVRL